MISPDYCRLMARYNAWQNQSLLSAAGGLSDEDRWRDRGAFFRSIAETLNHLYWDDALWLARFAGNERPEADLHPALDRPAVWEEFSDRRRQRDAEIVRWAERVTDDDLKGDVAWYPAGGDTRIAKSRALCIVHLFNHQTHHRGQVHAMLTAAGTIPGPTDLPMLG